MSARRRAAFVAATVAIAALGLSMRALPVSPQVAKPRVFLVVVRDSNLLTMCPGAMSVARRGQTIERPGEQLAAPSIGRMRELRIPRDAGLEFGFLPVPSTGAATSSTELEREGVLPDLPVRRQVEQAFRRLGAYTVVDSVNDADLLFVVESLYVSVSASASALSVQPLTDGPRNLLSALIGIAADNKLSAAHTAPIGALLDAATWEGSALAMEEMRPGMVIFHPASVESLVRQFHGREVRPAGHPPVCAASDLVLAAPAVQAQAIRSGAERGARQAGADERTDSVGAKPLFSARVTYVTVPVTVVDRDGSIVSGLQKGDFRVFEDDVEQIVDRVYDPNEPFDVAVVVDTSLSMAWVRQEAQVSLLALINALWADDRVLLASFDDHIFVRSELTGDRRELRRGVFEMENGVGTRLYDALALVTEQRLSALTGRRAMVLVTDGRDTTSRLADADQILRVAARSEVPIFVVQKEAGAATEPKGTNHTSDRQTTTVASAFLIRLADNTGGRLFHASRQAQFDEAFGRIASELRQQYTLSYYPSDQHSDGRYRRIRVEVNRPGAEVRSRSGYWAVGPRTR